MKNEFKIEVNIVLKGTYKQTDYKFQEIGSLSILQITPIKKSYFVVGSLPEMIKKYNLFCPRCNFDLYYSPVPLIIVGNGDVLIVATCGYCHSFMTYDIEEKAKTEIISILNISKELINNEMQILDKQYLQ